MIDSSIRSSNLELPMFRNFQKEAIRFRKHAILNNRKFFFTFLILFKIYLKDRKLEIH